MGNWVIFELRGESYGVRAEQVAEMVILDRTTAMPRRSETMRGLLNLRGTIYPLLDLRRKLGLPGAPQEIAELCDLLAAHEQEHVRWLAELESCVRDRREFTLALDPAQCAFGRWHAAFRTEDAVLRLQLTRLAEPHRQLHAAAAPVLQAAAEHDAVRVQAALAAARTGPLAAVRSLLAEARQMIRDEHREIAIIAATTGDRWGVVVDAVVGVRDIPDDRIERARPGSLGPIESGLVGFHQDGAALTLLLDLASLAGVARPAPAPEPEPVREPAPEPAARPPRTRTRKPAPPRAKAPPRTRRAGK